MKGGSMDKKAFATCIKRNREKQSLSLEDLEKLTGISIEKLMEFETGEFERIRASELKEIGKAINVPPLVLMSGGGMVSFRHQDENGKHICEWIEY